MAREMKDSGIPWIGVIPDSWEIKRLKEVFVECKEKSLDGAGELLSLSQYTGVQQKKDTDKAGTHESETYEGYNVVHKGQLVMNIMLAWNGSYAISDYDGIISPAYCVFDFRIDCAKRYFHYLLRTNGYPSAFKTLSRGIIDSRLRLYPEQFYTFPTVLPPLSTQQRIADFLDRKCAEIDELAALQETMIEELKHYKQSLITETVTKGLDKNAKMKPSGVEWIGEIPEGWVVLPFKQMYQLGKGLSITKADLVEQGVPVVSYGQIHSKSNTGTTIKDELIRYVPTSFLENSKDALVKIGDVIFADTSEDLEGCGNCIYVDRDMTLFAGYHTIIASNRSGSFSRYLPYLFKTDCWRMQIRAVVNGVKLFSVPQKTLAATSIILPPLYEQQQIADYLDRKCAEIDELIAIKQQKIEALKEYKKSVIFEYVTGKKEVE